MSPGRLRIVISKRARLWRSALSTPPAGQSRPVTPTSHHTSFIIVALRLRHQHLSPHRDHNNTNTTPLSLPSLPSTRAVRILLPTVLYYLRVEQNHCNITHLGVLLVSTA